MADKPLSVEDFRRWGALGGHARKRKLSRRRLSEIGKLARAAQNGKARKAAR